MAGIFLFLPLLARVGFDRIVSAAGYPESRMIPAPSALLSLLALKLLDKERRSHIADFNFDEALGLFAGLNVLPKKTFANDYSFRTSRAQQTRFLSGWIGQLSPLLFPTADSFCLDFHAIPYRGDPSGLDNHYLPMRGKAGASVLTFFAHEQKSRVFCYANANLNRQNQTGEPLRFVEFWHALAGRDPQWLYFDSKLVDYPELSKINQRGISFITIRRRGQAIFAPPRTTTSQFLAVYPPRHSQTPAQKRPLPGRTDHLGRLRRIAAPSGCWRPGPRTLHPVCVKQLRDYCPRPHPPLCRPQRCGGQSRHQRQLLPSRLLGQ